MVLRCTRKVLELLGGRALTLTDPPPSDEDWYLNLLWLDRRKCLLITHAGTLFSVLVSDVRKPDLRPLGRFVVDALESELRAEGLPPDTLGQLDSAAVQLAKTASRSTLGFMNEMALYIRYDVAAAGGLSNCDVSALNQHLRRTLHYHGGYVYPIDLVTQRLADRPKPDLITSVERVPSQDVPSRATPHPSKESAQPRWRPKTWNDKDVDPA